MTHKLHEGDHLRIYWGDPGEEGYDDTPYRCVKPAREYGVSEADFRDMRQCRDLWARVTACCIDADSISGWVYRKHIHEFACREPEFVPEKRERNNSENASLFR